MAWYFNTGDNCYHKEYKVEVWRWWPNGIFAFNKWAKEHNIHYSIAYSCQKDIDMLFFDDDEISFKLVHNESFLIYAPWRDFPFEVLCFEDFHKYYLWCKGLNEKWEWNEESLEHFRLWAKEHDIQFRRTLWDKEGHGDLLSFPTYRNEHNITQGVIIWPGDILYYCYDKRANGEFPFTVIKKETYDE